MEITWSPVSLKERACVRASEHSSDKGMVYMAVVVSVRGRDCARVVIAGVEDDQEQVKSGSEVEWNTEETPSRNTSID